jgi:hypothetical protein
MESFASSPAFSGGMGVSPMFNVYLASRAATNRDKLPCA